ncbi:MAG: hypothetical protein COA32_10970 [Fluviicola sp.]|nr:MAG: hypothetical protein COA32_10970 [Fluviicola sp.]
MNDFVDYFLFIHILAGILSLIFGFLAIISLKGGKMHKRMGRVYALSMMMVFLSGTLIAGIKSNTFLFLIAFLSFYSVFCGVRILKLKQLHLQQKAKWYDWFAGILNAIVNVVFVIVGLYYGFTYGFNSGGTLLSIGFGIGGVLISYTNLLPFIKRPEESYHWYLSHIGNMMGGYIATLTAFLSTMVTRFELMNPFVAFALPSLIGIPILFWYQSQIKKQYNTSKIN